jgi:large subunit ribosomal protein L4
MKLSVVKISGAAAGEIEIADGLLIKNGRGTQAVHDAVMAYRSNQRLGTVKVKQMGEVAGTGKKPWKQKGTGRARAGSFQSPLWRGGAVVFGPRPRDYSLKITKKTKVFAFRKAVSERLLAGDVVVVDELNLKSHKTKAFVAVIAKLAPQGRTTLVVTEKVDDNLKRASQNLPDVSVEQAASLNVYELLQFDKIVVTKAALAAIEARLQ